jgi:hypothetical protein
MQTLAAGYALTNLTTLKLHLVNRSVAGLTDAKFKPLILPMKGFLSKYHVQSATENILWVLSHLLVTAEDGLS